MSAGPSVVGLGGGHGLAATLAAARRFASSVTAVVSVADDGGSSGRLRRDLGVPAPGDIRRCLVALAAEPEGLWARTFAWRFDRGDVQGHVLGNLVLAALAQRSGTFAAAVDTAAALLDVQGRVLPATHEPVVLLAYCADRAVRGQSAVEAAGGRIDRVALEPADPAVPAEVLDAVAGADLVVLGPGSLYTSVLAVCAVPAIRDALAARSGGVVFVCNLQPSKETVGFDLGDHLGALVEHGVVPDIVLVDPDTMPAGARRFGGPRVVEAPLARPNRWSHDPGLLAAALADLARG